MKITNRYGNLLFLAFLFLLALPMLCFGQDTNTVAAPAIPLDGVLQSLLGKFAGVASVVFIVVGVLRVTIKPLLTIVEAVVKATPTKSDDEYFVKVQTGPVMKWVLYALDWVASVKMPGATTANPLVKDSVSVTTSGK